VLPPAADAGAGGGVSPSKAEGGGASSQRRIYKWEGVMYMAADRTTGESTWVVAHPYIWVSLVLFRPTTKKLGNMCVVQFYFAEQPGLAIVACSTTAWQQRSCGRGGYVGCCYNTRQGSGGEEAELRCGAPR
jgi:hypothetical protein